MKTRLSQGWIRVALYSAAALVFPEYLAPVFAVLAFIAALCDSIRKKRNFFAGTLIKPAVLILILMCVGLFYTENIISTLGSIGLIISAMLFYIALTSEIITRRQLELTIFIVAVAVAVNGIIAGAQFLIGSTMGFDINMSFWRSFDNSLLGLFGKGLTYYEGERAASTFCNPNVFAQSMAMLLPFGLYFACSHRKDSRHNACRVLVPIAFFGTLFSFSRGAYLALIVILLCFGLYHIKKLRFVLIAAVVIILLIPSSVYTRFVSINGVQEYITQVIQDFNTQSHANYGGSLLDSLMTFFQSALSHGGVEESSRLRFDAWLTTMTLVLKKPFFGYGAGYMNVREILFAAGIPVFHTHNFILQTLMEGGIALLAAVIWLEVLVLKKGLMLIRQTSNPKLGLATLCFIFSFVLVGLTDIPTLTPKLIASFAIALALCESSSSLYYERRLLTVEEALNLPGKLFGRKDK